MTRASDLLAAFHGGVRVNHHDPRARARLRAIKIAPCDACDGRFLPSDDGFLAYVTVVHAGIAGHVIDLVAWRPDDPSMWWLWSGAVSVLGQRSLDVDSLDDGPILVHPNPADWLEGCYEASDTGRRDDANVCVVAWDDPAAVRLAFAAARHRRVICTDIATAERLAGALTPPVERWDIHVLVKEGR